MFMRFINYTRIGEKYSISPFDVPKKFTFVQIDFMLAAMQEEETYRRREEEKTRNKL